MRLRSLPRGTPAVLLIALLIALVPMFGSAPASAAPSAARSAAAASSNFLTISPQATTPGGKVNVFGCGFIPGEFVNVQLVNPFTLAPFGTTQQIQAQPSGSSAGCLDFVNNQFFISGAASGTYLVRAQGGNLFTLYGFVAVSPSPPLTINPSTFAYNPGGTIVNVSGAFVDAGTLVCSLSTTNNPGTPLSGSTESLGATAGVFNNVAYVVQPNATAGTYFLYCSLGPGSPLFDLNIGIITITSGGPPAPGNGVLTFATNPISTGQTETATGCGFGSISSVSLTIATSPGGTTVYGPVTITNVVSTGVAGCYFITFVVPSLPAGTYLVSATNGITDSGLLQINTGIGVGSLQFFTNPINSGQTETATGCGFGLISSVSLTISTFPGGTIVYGPVTITNVVSTGIPGCYNITFVVPSLPTGTYTVSATNGGTTDSGLLQINIGTGNGFGVLTLSPSTATIGTQITASGCGFTLGETISAVITSSGLGASAPLSISTPVFTGTGFNGTACYTFTFFLPSLANGIYTVRATGSVSGTIDTGTLNVASGLIIGPPPVIGGASLTASPSSLAPGQSTTLTGSGFSAFSIVTLSGIGPVFSVGTVNGSFTATLTIPSGTAPGTYLETAQDGTGRVATTSITVTGVSSGATLVVSVSSAQASQSVTVTGTGFGANEQVSLSLGAPSTAPFAISGTIQLFTTSANGSFTVTYVVPNVASGTYLLLALGQTSRIFATTPFSVVASAVVTPPVVPPIVPPVVPPVTPSAPLPSVSTASTVTYFADGYTGTASTTGKVTFTERLYFYNPGSATTTVTTVYAVYNSATQSRTTVTETDTVAPGATVVRSVNTDVGNDRQVSATVRASAGIVAEEAISRVSNTGQTLDADSSLGSPRLDQAWYFAEGYTGETFQEYLILYNPGATDAHAKIQYLPSGDTQAPAATPVTVPAHGQVAVNVRSDYNALVPMGSKNIGAQVTSDVPIAVDRSLYWGDGNGSGKFGYSTGPGISSGARTSYLAFMPTSSGSQSFVTVLNPNSSSTTVTLNLVDASGTSLKTVSATVGPNRRYTFVVPTILPGSNGDIAGAVVSSDTPVIAEIGIYFGGSPNFGLHPGLVVQGSAGGQIGARASLNTRGGQLHVYNPGSGTIRIQVTVGGQSSGTPVFDANVAGNSSKTIALPSGTGPRGVLVRGSGNFTAVLVNGGVGNATAWGGNLT